MCGKKVSLVAAIIIASSASAWSSNIRTPLFKAFPSCDQQAIEFLAPLRKQEVEFVAEQALKEAVDDRYSLRKIEVAKERHKFRAGTFEHKQEIQLLNEIEQQNIAHLEKCEPLLKRYARGSIATQLAIIPASRLDRELLQLLIDNGAVLEAPPISTGKVDNPASVWKRILHAAVGSLYISEARKKDSLEFDEGIKQAALEKFIPVVLDQVKHVNTRDPEHRTGGGDTILHILAAGGSSSAGYAIRYLITKRNADPRIRNKKGETPLDLYAGNDKEIMALLSGFSSVATPESVQSPQKIRHGTDDVSPITSLPNGSFTGFITSTLNKGEKINGTLNLKEQGDFEYQGNNGVTLKGRFLQGGGNRITGSGVSQLPTLLGIPIFKYPDGTTSTTLKFNGKVTPDSLAGVFESAHETGTFAFNLVDQK